MKQIFIVCLCCALFLFAGCGGQAAPAPDVSITPWSETSQWPDNEFTRMIPQPATGTVCATMEGTSAGYDFFAVQLDRLSRAEIQDYLLTLEQAGYESLAGELGFEPSVEGVTVGDLLYRDGTYLSLAAGDRGEDNSLGLLISRLSEG